MLLGAGIAQGQSLYETRQVGIPEDLNGTPQPSQSLEGYSMFVITPPPPKRLALHDLVTIIVNETSRSSRSQSLETDKEYTSEAQLARFPSMSDFFEGRLIAGDAHPDNLLEIDATSEFKGEGEYERADRMTARIQAEVIDIKPNGVLVLEARSSIQTDEEIQVFVLSGNCRSDDITDQNTIQSSQLHNLNIVSKNEGEVRKSAKKGLIPRALEAIFAF
jgi:flagellar L-ring protein precursor FlgH